MLMQSPSPGLLWLGQAGFVLALGVQFGVQGALLVEITPEAVRCTALAIRNNIAWSIVGGLVPLTATWLVWRSGNPLAPAWYLLLAAIVGLVAMSLMPETAPVKVGRG
jgi:uncharacterized membrane protein